MKELLDYTRTIEVDRGFKSVEDGLDYLVRVYARNRSEGQEWAIYIVVEKRGQAQQLRAWFGGRSIPIVSLSGYASQSIIHRLARDIATVQVAAQRVALLYAGDFDCDGIEIERDFLRRLHGTGLFANSFFGFKSVGFSSAFEHERVVLSAEQVDEYTLPENPGKDTSSTAAKFEAEYGVNVQVELDALDPADLRRLFEERMSRLSWNFATAVPVVDGQAG